MHENSRGDRDEYVQFNCHNLIGFAEALEKATTDGFTKDELCNNFNVANNYKFDATQYYKWENKGMEYSSDYDYNSIMHYSSWQSHNPALTDADPTNLDKYPLVLLTGGRNRQKSLLPLPLPYPDWQISKFDEDSIKMLYPWE
jgi:hypothetical protein